MHYSPYICPLWFDTEAISAVSFLVVSSAGKPISPYQYLWLECAQPKGGKGKTRQKPGHAWAAPLSNLVSLAVDLTKLMLLDGKDTQSS